MKTLADSDLVYLDIHAKHYPERIEQSTLLLAIEELQEWRKLGKDPQDVEEHLNELESERDWAREEAQDLRTELQNLSK